MSETVQPAAPAPAPTIVQNQIPAIGRIVIYTLTEADAATINARRARAAGYVGSHLESAMGGVVHQGNDVSAGDVFPMMIVKTWGSDPTSAVQGQVFLDGSDVLWATSRVCGTEPGTWAWPTKD